MHLTNYAINKESENYVPNNLKADNEQASKRSMEEVFEGIG